MNNHVETTTLGGGCFWCVEAIYLDVAGVEKVVSGYAGGHVANPTYEQICAKNTGHAEVIQVSYDPTIITYEEILTLFWRIHDPTTPNKQGNDVGPQYRSIILTHNDEQHRLATTSKANAEAEGLYPNPIVTEIVSLEIFYPAEDYHQNYYNQNRLQPYCMMVVDPKVKKFRKSFQEKLKSSA